MRQGSRPLSRCGTSRTQVNGCCGCFIVASRHESNNIDDAKMPLGSDSLALKGDYCCHDVTSSKWNEFWDRCMDDWMGEDTAKSATMCSLNNFAFTFGQLRCDGTVLDTKVCRLHSVVPTLL